MKQLYDYQQEVVERVHQSWKSGHKRPCVVLPCGAGKSVIAAEYARRTTERDNRVLFIVHRKELCEQIHGTFKWWDVNMDLCHIGMVQTVTRHLDREPEPKLILTDEAHHSRAGGYKRIFDKWPNAYMVGLTATPERLDGKGLGDVYDDLIVGPSAQWLIDNQRLSPERYYTYDLIKAGRTQAGEYVMGDIKIDAAQRDNIVKVYLEKTGGAKAVCYMPTVKRSLEMAETFRNYGISAEHMDANTPKALRDAIVKRFRDGDTQVLCNVDLVSEGFDVPDCDCSILCRPTKSLTVFIQQSMRCMRYVPDKTATVLDFVNNVSRFGLPEYERQWTLEDKPKKDKGFGPPTKTCPDCDMTVPTMAKYCPVCGYEFPDPKDKGEAKHLALELHEVKKIKVPSIVRFEDCRNFSDLRAYGKFKGYKDGWAYYQARNKGWI